jgi:hypothetical protein
VAEILLLGSGIEKTVFHEGHEIGELLRGQMGQALD